MYTVYQHKNKINGKVYIGITSQKLEQRWGSQGCNYKSSPHFYSAIQKYGWDNFEHNILFDLTKEQACLKEKSHKKLVYCEELDKIFESVQECSRQLGIPATSISKLCNGRGKTLKGYHLRYYNDTINA
jgi:predicted GIY-YIG superfamily endonuclease